MMKASLLTFGLSALFCPFKVAADNIPDDYAVSKFTSSSPNKEVDGLAVQAVNGTLRLGGSATILCDPEVGNQCETSDITALYNYTSLYVNYAEGQTAYLDSKYQWRYTEPIVPGDGEGSPAIPPGAITDGFYFYPCKGDQEKYCYTPHYGRGGWIACPPIGEKEDQRWFVFSNYASDESVPTGKTTDCRWFDAVSVDHEEESDIYLYA